MHKNVFPNLETVLTSYAKQNSKSDKIRILQTSGITVTARKNSSCRMRMIKYFERRHYRVCYCAFATL